MNVSHLINLDVLITDIVRVVGNFNYDPQFECGNCINKNYSSISKKKLIIIIILFIFQVTVLKEPLRST